MKREIKFRAWSEKNKEMYFPDENYCFRIYNDSIGFYPHHSSDDLYFFNTNPCDGELKIDVMQYTGLKDKNGKEIYEGDLCYIFIDRPEPIVFVDGAFGYMDVDGYFISFAQNKWFFWTDYKSNEIEVLGNIYENPELLETKNVQLSEPKAE